MRLLVTALLVAPMLAPTDADARSQPVRCDTIQRGETVFAVARRVTGRADNRRETVTKMAATAAQCEADIRKVSI